MEENFERISRPLTTDGFTIFYVDFFLMLLNFLNSVTGNTIQRVWPMVTEYNIECAIPYHTIASQIGITLTCKLGVC